MREGDPAALAALCAVRGPSVVAYCRHIAGEADAGAAAADAFARFRAGVVSAPDPTSVDPEALLISATRTSAAAHANTTGEGDCGEVPALLAARAAKTIAPAELERLGSHLERCWACRAPVARFKAAELAYRDPPEKTVDPALSAQIIGALIAAVPPAPAPDVKVSSNGSTAHAALAAPAVPLDQPTEQLAPPEPRTAPEPHLPAVPRERDGRSRARLRLAFVLPIVLIVLALTAALYVSGIFGGKDPESSSTVAAPTAEPVDRTKPELVVVPGARNASAEAVEDAKARARGEREPSAAKQDEAKAGAADEAPAPAPSRPPPATPAPAASPPPPPASANSSSGKPAPDPRPQTKPAEEKQIDAGGGATGAEPVAPPAASDVPDLAPPPASATTP